MTFIRDAEQPDHAHRRRRPGTSTTATRRPATSSASSYPNGTTQTFTYDAEHNLLTASGGGQLVRTVHYDDAGRVTAITDGNGNTTTIDTDVDGHQQVITDRDRPADDRVDTYNDRGNVDPRRISIADGQHDHDHGDLRRRRPPALRTDGLGHTTSQTYDAAGNVLTETDAQRPHDDVHLQRLRPGR